MNMYQKKRFLLNGWQLKIRLLQSFEVVWIHLCEYNCRQGKSADGETQTIFFLYDTNMLQQRCLEFEWYLKITSKNEKFILFQMSLVQVQVQVQVLFWCRWPAAADWTLLIDERSFNCVHKMPLWVFYFIRALTKVQPYYYHSYTYTKSNIFY